MLIEFRVTNFRSFNEGQTLSLVASRDDKHPENLVSRERYSLLKAVAIYGANASGKSNLIRAIRFLRNFILNSATQMNQGDPILGINPFRLSPESQKRPSVFDISFIVDGTRFEYSFSVSQDRVHGEWLSAYPPPHRRRQRWLERSFDPATKGTAWAFRGPLKNEARILKEKTRDNGLVLARGAELNIKALADPFLWFRHRLWCFDMSNLPIPLMTTTAKRIKEDPDLMRGVLQMIQHADLGIEGMDVAEQSVAPEDFPEKLRELLSEEGMRKIAVPILRVRTLHRTPDLDSPVSFEMSEDESNGTQRFFALAGPVLDAFDQGAVVVVDELECSMHPLLTRKLVELFQSPEVNDKGAQLIFVTHDSTLMDPELFRRDQLWLVEKNPKGASELFSLYDFDTRERPRNTEAFQRNYLAGRYGGVPSFGPTFEDLELK